LMVWAAAHNLPSNTFVMLIVLTRSATSRAICARL
jgi:hypothetical protein